MLYRVGPYKRVCTFQLADLAETLIVLFWYLIIIEKEVPAFHHYGPSFSRYS